MAGDISNIILALSLTEGNNSGSGGSGNIQEAIPTIINNNATLTSQQTHIISNAATQNITITLPLKDSLNDGTQITIFNLNDDFTISINEAEGEQNINIEPTENQSFILNKAKTSWYLVEI